MDAWKKIENNLAAIKKAGAEIVGEELKASYRGGLPREKVIAEYKRKMRWDRYRKARWPEW